MLKNAFLLLVIHVLVFIAIHATNINYFVADDVSAYLLPQIKVQYETIFKHFQIPQINYYIYLGHPVLAQGQTSVFYLPYYLFFYIAQMFGNYDITFVISAFVHIYIAIFGFFNLIKYYCISESNAINFAAAVAYGYNGFVLQRGSTWSFVLVYVAFLPYIFLCLERLRERKFRFLFILLHTLLFYVGYSNFFYYMVLLELFYVMLCRFDWVYWRGFFKAYVYVFVMSLPLILPILNGFYFSIRQNTDLIDRFLYRNTLTNTINSFYVFPCSVWWQDDYCPNLSYFNSFAFILFYFGVYFLIRNNKRLAIGIRVVLQRANTTYLDNKTRIVKKIDLTALSLFLGILLFGLVISGILVDFVFIALLIYVWLSKNKRHSKFLVFLLIYILTVILSVAPVSLISILFFPITAIFRMPMKWMFFSQFFLSLICLYLVKHINLSKKFNYAILAVVCVLTVTAAHFATYIYTFGYKSYREIPNEILQIIEAKNYRYSGIIDYEKSSGILYQLVPANYAGMFSVFYYSGYDPLVSYEKSMRLGVNNYNGLFYDYKDSYGDIRERIKEYGVKFLFVDKDAEQNVKDIEADGGEIVYENNNIWIYELDDVKPLVFDEYGNEVGFTIVGNKIIVLLDEIKQNLTFNFMKDLPEWRAEIDGVAVVPEADEFSRLKINLNGAKYVVLEYYDPMFDLGVKSALVGIIILLGFSFLRGKSYRHAPVKLNG